MSYLVRTFLNNKITMKNVILPITLALVMTGCQKEQPITESNSTPQDGMSLKKGPGWGLNNTFIVTIDSDDYFDAECIPCAVATPGLACNCFDAITIKGINNNVYQDFINAADNNTLSDFFNHPSYNGLFPRLKKFPNILNSLQNDDCGAVRVPSRTSPNEYFYLVVRESDRYDENGNERTGDDLASRCDFSFHFRTE
jgi:hypothetical protein